MNDKNQAIIDYLITCPQIYENPLFFNFINAKDMNQQIVTLNNEKSLQTPYVDGSVLKRYSFTIIAFRSISTNAIVKQDGYTDENVEEMLDVQGIIDWIDEQNENRNYPNFGENTEIDSIKATTDNPNLRNVDTSVNPYLAQYAITIQVDYIDNSKLLWN